jgi:protein-S-isoprenylcysteine O-methyltransferase Ste14
LIRLLAALRSLLYAGVFVLLWWWVVVSVRPFDDQIPFTLPEWLRMPGLILIVSGAALVLWCLAAFSWEGRGTPAPFDAPRKIVVTGPYRYVRNPMYLAAMLIILGVGLMLRSPSAVGVAVFFISLAHLFVLAYEEPTLQAQFGESYSEYKLSVDRWLPRVPRDSERS